MQLWELNLGIGQFHSKEDHSPFLLTVMWAAPEQWKYAELRQNPGSRVSRGAE